MIADEAGETRVSLPGPPKQVSRQKESRKTCSVLRLLAAIKQDANPGCTFVQRKEYSEARPQQHARVDALSSRAVPQRLPTVVKAALTERSWPDWGYSDLSNRTD